MGSHGLCRLMNAVACNGGLRQAGMEISRQDFSLRRNICKANSR